MCLYVKNKLTKHVKRQDGRKSEETKQASEPNSDMTSICNYQIGILNIYD